MRNLDLLAGATEDQSFKAFIAQNAQTAWSRDRNETNFFDFDWAGPFDYADIGTQASAVSLLVAAL